MAGGLPCTISGWTSKQLGYYRPYYKAHVFHCMQNLPDKLLGHSEKEKKRKERKTVWLQNNFLTTCWG